MLQTNTPYADLDCAATLAQDSLRNESRIKIEREKERIYANTIRELESEQRDHNQRLQALESMVASQTAQASQLKEDIRDTSHYGASFLMRVSAHDEADAEADYNEDASRRAHAAATLAKQAKEAHDALQRLGQRRIAKVISKQAACANLKKYRNNVAALVDLADQLKDSDAGDAAGGRSGNESTAASPQALRIAGDLHTLARRHSARDENSGQKLADLAADQVERLRNLAFRPAIFDAMNQDLTGPDYANGRLDGQATTQPLAKDRSKETEGASES